MGDYKLCISDPKTGKSYQIEAKGDQSKVFSGLKIGDSIDGGSFGAAGYELKITGGSDYCGFPMRHGILGVRKRINILGGVGFSGKGRKGIRMKGMKKRKTICGHKINDSISQINLVVVKEGTKKLGDALGIEDKKTEEADKAGAHAKADKAKAEETVKEDKPKAEETAKEDKPKVEVTAKADKPKTEKTAKAEK
ncbi:MAG: S6e family ribosomal protein [Nanoarchaeota archaeon]